MTQTTGAVVGVNCQVLVSRDLAEWYDISGSANQLTAAEQRRQSGEAYTFVGDTAILTQGKREPVELTLRALYTEELDEAWERARTFFETAGGQEVYLRWRVGDRRMTTARAVVTRFNYPTADAADAAPVPVEFSFRSHLARIPAWERFRDVCGDALVGLWRLAEEGGTVAYDSSGNRLHGAHTDIAAYGAEGPAGPALEYDGTGSVTNLSSADLAAAFDPDVGSLGIWLRVAGAPVWSDGAARVAIHIGANANNRVTIQKDAANEQLSASYVAGGTTKTVTMSANSTNWLFVAATWDKTADRFIVYLNGSAVGSPLTGLGAWSGDADYAFIGAGTSTPTQVWDGFLALGFLCDGVLTPEQIAEMALTD